MGFVTKINVPMNKKSRVNVPSFKVFILKLKLVLRFFCFANILKQ